MRISITNWYAFLALIFSFCISINGYAQITSVDYKIMYNESSNQFDVYLRVLEGKTTSTKHRIQFNSQISIIVPTGAMTEITKHYMPLQDNQQLTGTTPMEWDMIKPLISPPAMPKYDVYAVRPTLMPTALYNEMKAGDEIKLFSFKCETNTPSEVRLFKNGEDPSSTPEMFGRDFFNAFCIGSIEDVYKKGNM
jgi:hypothetical protein